VTAVFADTFYWYALTNPLDQWHKAALEARKAHGARLVVTTDEVLGEYLAAMSRHTKLRSAAALLIEALRNDPSVTIVAQSRQTFDEGFRLYCSRPDKQYSHTDCTSMNACRQAGIVDVLTNDHHFEQEGFHILISR